MGQRTLVHDDVGTGRYRGAQFLPRIAIDPAARADRCSTSGVRSTGVRSRGSVLPGLGQLLESAPGGTKDDETREGRYEGKEAHGLSTLYDLRAVGQLLAKRRLVLRTSRVPKECYYGDAMTMDAYVPPMDPNPLGRLVNTLAEDAIFGLSCGSGDSVFEGLGKRRADAYIAVASGHRLHTMAGEFDNWVVELTRAVAPIAPPAWMPMAEVIREKVTLEVGARGLRALFSSKPSEKDIQRVKRLGTLAVRVLRAVFVADGELDHEEQRTIAGLVASLGLPDEVAQALYAEEPIPVEQLDIYGDIEAAVGKALLRGAWLASAWDQIDPREEHVVRVVANKLSFAAMDLEVLRNEAVQRVDRRRSTGLAAVDAVRFVLEDCVPGHGVTLAAKVAHLMIPKRHRDEALAQIGAGSKLVLAKRYAQLSSDEKQVVLGVAWAAALYEDPTVSRKAILRARHERVAADLGDDGARARYGVENWIAEALALAASSSSVPSS